MLGPLALAIIAASVLISGLLVLRRRGRQALGFAALLAVNLGLAGYALGVPDAHPAFFFAAVAAFTVLVLVPGGIGVMTRRALRQGRLDRAISLVRLRQMFQPGAGLGRDLEILRGLALVHEGRMDDAIDMRRAQLEEDLEPALRVTVLEQLLTFLLYRRAWSEAADLFTREGGEGLATVSASAAAAAARALLELDRFDEAARVQGILEHGKAGRSVSDALVLNQTRLVFLAHMGKEEQLAPLVQEGSGFLPGLTPGHRDLWRAVAMARAGREAESRELLLSLVGAEDNQLSEAATHRLDQPVTPLPSHLPDPEMEALCGHAAAAAGTYRGMPRFRGRVWQLAPVTTALMAIIVLVHLGIELVGNSQDGWTLTRFGANLALATRGAEPWRLVTSMFLHAGWLHLAVNLYTLFVLGRFVEQLFGSRRFWVLYLVAGVIGSAASAYLGGDQRLSVGASGAIFGLLGGALVGMLRLRGHVPEAWRRQVTYNLLIVIALNVYIGYTVPRVDNSAHMGGLVGGVLMGLMLIRARAGQGRGWAGLTPAALTLAAVTLLCGAMAAHSSSGALLKSLPQKQHNRGGLGVTVPGHWFSLEEDALLLQDPLLEISPTLQFEVVGLPEDQDLGLLAADRTRSFANRLGELKEVQGVKAVGPPWRVGPALHRSELRVRALDRVFRQVHLFRRQGGLAVIALVRLPDNRVKDYEEVLAEIARSMVYRIGGTMGAASQPEP